MEKEAFIHVNWFILFYGRCWIWWVNLSYVQIVYFYSFAKNAVEINVGGVMHPAVSKNGNLSNNKWKIKEYMK